MNEPTSTMNDDPLRLLTSQEVAERCAVSLRTVQSWIEASRLQVVRFGARAVRVRESELRRFVDDHSTEPTS